MMKVYVAVDNHGSFIGYDGLDDAIYIVENVIQVVGNTKLELIQKFVDDINESYMEEGIAVLNKVEFPLRVVEVELSYKVNELI